MKKLTNFVILVGVFFISYLSYPAINFSISKNTFINLVRECEKSKNDLQSLDIISENESIETRVNLFMNAKANEFSCFDLKLLENELLASRVSQEKINYLKIKSISKDPLLIENMNLEN